MFCSTLIASYKRSDLLVHAIESLRATAETPAEHEVLVRLSNKDPEAPNTTASLKKQFSNVLVLIGDHLNGYASLGDYFTELAEYATGQWVNIFDDDMTLEGVNWDEKLHAVPDKSFVVCERYRLDTSDYLHGCDGPGIAWFVPRDCWKHYGEDAIGNPPDTWMKHLLVDQNGWQNYRLPGITLNHQRMHDKDSHT